MKTRFIISAILEISCLLFSYAQNGYYYYDGEKVPLDINADKISLLIPNNTNNQILKNRAQVPQGGKTIRNKQYEIHVFNSKNHTFTKEYDVKQNLANPHETPKIIPVYQTVSFDELILTNHLHIRLKCQNDYYILDSLAKRYALEIEEQEEYDLPLWYTLSITPQTQSTSLEIANMLYETQLFASSYPSFSYDARLCITEPDFDKQWGLHNGNNIDISACNAWSIATGKGITIAIIDDGIDLTHSDLTSNLHSFSYNLETNTRPSKTYGHHGTHCAGIAAAAINGKFIAGVAPNAKLMSISHNMIMTSDAGRKFAQGINLAWQNGADIISCSWQAPQEDMLKEAIDNALSQGRQGKGTIIVVAAGNEYHGTVTWPGCYREEIITVSSIEADGSFSDFSSMGSFVDVCAPGGHIYSTFRNDSVGYMNGTSMACPHVAGVAALILERNPTLTNLEVRNAIERNTKKIGNVSYTQQDGRPNGTWNEQYGYGLIDAYAATMDNCPATYIRNLTISDTISYSGACKFHLNNINVQKGSKLIINANKETIIESDFEVVSGAELEIK